MSLLIKRIELSFSIYFLLSIVLLSSSLDAQEPGKDVTKAADEETKHYSVSETKAKREAIIEKEQARDGDVRFNYAQMLFLESKTGRAEELWNDFIILFPNHPRVIDAMHYLAVILEQKGHYKKALVAYLRCHKKGGGRSLSIKSHLQAGRLLVHLGELAKAERIFKDIVAESKLHHFSKMAQIELDFLKQDLEINVDKEDGTEKDTRYRSST